ncbi:hypothetical protein HJC23_008783 [Cyclotella cryptica]|uniref:Uncharacterized protein n=1 Tax=Cyclotella cryptica TaxID=29204 RepID=A0ABD3PRT4_9STRA|eukprot:CCRYP_012181-RA/>CCRYP_012181-RA protein AED:0.06 eAED:0.06 QI:45/1/1/1/0/0/2/166/364
MSSLCYVSLAFAFPSFGTSSHPGYLRKTKGETRLGRPEGFTWTNLDNSIASTTSSTFVSSSTELASTSSTAAISTSSAGFTTSTTYWQLSTTTDSEIGSSTEIASLPTTSSTDRSTLLSTTVSLSDVVTAPSAEFVATAGSVSYIWTGGVCKSDFDCYPEIRERVPGSTERVGVELCECYANSFYDPLDECQRNSDCPIAGCLENACFGLTTHCSVEKGVCVLNSLDKTELASADDDELAASLPTEEVAMSMPDRQGWCVDDLECQGDEICVDEANGMCFFPPCGRCTDSLNVVGETMLSLSELSMSVPVLSLNQGVIEFEWGEPETSLTCGNHHDCVEIDGCCMSDGMCRQKTEAMPICWWLA